MADDPQTKLLLFTSRPEREEMGIGRAIEAVALRHRHGKIRKLICIFLDDNGDIGLCHGGRSSPSHDIGLLERVKHHLIQHGWPSGFDDEPPAV